MKCKECPHRKENDAIRQLEDNVEWYCTLKHSECEDIVCLLRMIIWQLNHIAEDNEDNP